MNKRDEWVKWLNRIQLLATPWTVAYYAPPSMGFSRQEYWSQLQFPSPEDLPKPGSNPSLLHRRQTLYLLRHQGGPKDIWCLNQFWTRSNPTISRVVYLIIFSTYVICTLQVDYTCVGTEIHHHFILEYRMKQRIMIQILIQIQILQIMKTLSGMFWFYGRGQKRRPR